MRILIMILVGFSILYGEHFWSDFRSNYRQDGLAKCVGPRDPNFLWEYEFGTIGRESKINNLRNPYYSPGATAVISSDSTVYAFSSVNDCLVAIKDDMVLWRETFNSQYDSNIVIDSEGILYFPVIFDGYHRLVSYDPNDRIILWYSEQGWGTGTVNVVLGPDSILYVSLNDKNIRAINKTDGKTLWTYESPDGVRRIAYGTDKWLYFFDFKQKVSATDGNTTKTAGPFPDNSLDVSINPEGAVYFASKDTLFAYESGIVFKWKEALDDTTRISSPTAICPDGSIVVGSEGGYVHKVSKEGQYQWKSEKLVGSTMFLPTVDSEGKIFISCGGTYCINSNGDILYHILSYNGQCLIGPGRRLYIINSDEIRCFNDKNDFQEPEINTKPIPCKFNVSPNPFRDKLNIKSNVSVIIYSLTGQLIRRIEKGENVINTRNWKEGVYIIKSGKEIKKIVKIN